MINELEKKMPDNTLIAHKIIGYQHTQQNRCKVLNGGHNGHIGRENLSGIGIYQGYIGDNFKNRMSKSDCKYTYILILNRISIRQHMHKLYKAT